MTETNSNNNNTNQDATSAPKTFLGVGGKGWITLGVSTVLAFVGGCYTGAFVGDSLPFMGESSVPTPPPAA